MYRLPTSFEVAIIKKFMAVPKIKNEILRRNGFLIDYICVDCQRIKELPKYVETGDFDLDNEFEEKYWCPDCDSRMLQLETGEY